MNRNKNYTIIKQWLPIFFLLLYPLRKVNMGIDWMDAGYALGHYRFFDSMDRMWKLATYLANVTGMLLSRLPGGDTWFGMNVYTALMTGVTAAVTYRFLCAKLGHHVLIFLGEIFALSLCWAPSAVLYQYMGYYAMTAAVLLLYKALIENNSVCYIIAGVIIGLAVCIRMPNITYIALIIPVWYYGWLNRDKTWIRRTLLCIAGFGIGFLIPLSVISVRYGLHAYPDMISSLFGMTDTATDYKPTAMLTAIFGEYIQYSVWLFLFILYFIFGVILFRLVKGRLEWFKKILYVSGLPVLLRLCYGRGLFGLDYTDYFAMYKWVTVYLLVVILFSVVLLVGRNVKKEHKLWAMFLLVILFVTPLGGNNGLYYPMNNLFVVAPVSVCLMWETIKEPRAGKTDANYLFTFKTVVAFILVCTFIQSFLFGICFVFHENKAEGEDYVKAEIPGSSSTGGLYTTVDKKVQLEALGDYLVRNQLTEYKVLLYGGIPGISYIFDMEPAIFSTWPDLASNTPQQLEKSLAGIEGDNPVVIVTETVGEELDVLWGTKTAEWLDLKDAKLYAIAQYMQKEGYERTYGAEGFCVYLAK